MNQNNQLLLEAPAGWAIAEHASGRVDVTGPEGETVTVWPFFVQAPLQETGAAAVLRAMAAGVWPEARWSAPRSAGAGAVSARGWQGSRAISGLATWTASPQGSAGFTFFASAPTEDVYRRQTDRFAAIMQSVRLQGTPENGPLLTYVQWQDPNEQAFTMAFPAGWRVQGGTVRPGLAAVKAEVAATSPDDQVRLWFGDHYQMFVEPNPMLAFGGMVAGGSYMDPAGYRWVVQPYAPGASFLYYHFLPARLGAFELLSWQDLPQLAATGRSFGINHFDAGEVHYRFSRNGQTYLGHAIAITEVINPGFGSSRMWHLWRLVLNEALPDRQHEGEAAMAHGSATFAINPWWAQMQTQLTANQSRIIAEMGNAISTTIRQSYEYKQRVDDEISRRRSNATLFTTDVIDPVTGRQLKVEASSNYYWINHRGEIVGTQTATVPGVDFRSLIQLP